MDCIIDGYINLQAAIIEQAVTDYKWALKMLEKSPEYFIGRARHRYDEAEKKKIECEKFFLSKWGQSLTNGKGEFIIDRCRREVAQEKKESDLNGRS